jgi:serine/threonine protein kinase/tetratricopeptide (TPR) repeat protein
MREHTPVMPTRSVIDNEASAVTSGNDPEHAGDNRKRPDQTFPTAPPPAISPVTSNIQKAQIRAALFDKVEPIRIGHFILLQRLGAGSMGEIYAAYDEQLDRRVALKLVRHGSALTKQSDELLLREAKALAQVSHPNVVQIYETGLHEGRLFIAMEFIRGQTLTNWLHGAEQMPRPLRQREILRRFISAGRGLEAAHTAGVAHRDFKPDNVIVGDDGRVRVVDFGLARVLVESTASSTAKTDRAAKTDRTAKTDRKDAPVVVARDFDNGETVRFDPASEAIGAAATVLAGQPESPSSSMSVSSALPEVTAATALTRPGTVMGTPQFMAPEQMIGGLPDHRSDQFSFCVALYHALYGSFPFQGEYPHGLLDSIEAGVTGLEHGVRLGARLRRALCRGLAVDPSQRFANMGDLLSELESALRRRWGWIAGAVLVLLVVAAVCLRPFASGDPCAQAGRGIASSWSLVQQVATQIAFAHSRVPYANTAWQGVKRRLDDYTDRWQRLALTGCRARYVTHEQSELQFGLSMACLQRARQRVTSLVSELGGGATDAIQHAVDAAESLPELRTCNDPALIVFSPEPPPSAIAPEVEHVRQQLAAALTAERLGRTEQAVVIAREARAASERLNYPPVHAEALTQIARALDGRQTADARSEAEGLYADALDIAEGERHDQLAVMIWSRLVQLSVRMDSVQQAHERWRRNAAAVRRTGNSSYEQAKLRHMISEIYYRDGKYAEAEKSGEQAISMIVGAPERRLELSRYYDTLAKSQVRLGKIKAALDLHERALKIADEALGASHPDVVKRRINYGFALKRDGQLERARVELTSALDRMPQSLQQASMDSGIIHSQLSELSYDEGKLDDAAVHGREAAQIFDRAKAPDRRRAEAYSALANVELKRRNFQAALEMYEHALALRRELSRTHYQLGVNEGSIAEALLRLGRYGEANHHLTEAERIFSLGSEIDRQTRAWILTVRGELLAGQNRNSEAVAVLEQALPLCESGPDRSNEAYAASALARTLHRLGRAPERVRQLAEQARALFAKLGAHEASNLDSVEKFIQQLSPVPVSRVRRSQP